MASGSLVQRERTTVERIYSLFASDRLSIPQRISGGMGIILLLLVALSLYSWTTIAAVREKADYVNASVDQARTITRLAARVAETRAEVTQYALSENDADLRAAQRSLERVRGEIQSVGSDGLAGADKSVIDQLRALTDRYRNSVTATIEAINARRAHAVELEQAATELSTTVA